MTEELINMASGHRLAKGKTEGTSPKVSVIMNCYNCSPYLREAMDSVFAQTYQDWEIIFWDDASTDNSLAIAQSYGEKVRCFRGEKATTFAQVRKLAVNQARGDYIAFLDCDDLWLPTKLEKQIKLFEQNPELGLVFSDTIFFGNVKETKSLYSKHKPPRGNIFRHLLSNYCLSSETIIIRRKALESLEEGYDERMHVSEDVDLYLRLVYRYPADYVDEPLAKWRLNPCSLTHSRLHLMVEDKELLLKKLEQSIPNFSRDYAREIEAIKRKIAFRKSVDSWQKQNPALARQLLQPYLRHKKCLALFLATFLPHACFTYIWNLYYRYRYLFEI